MLNRIIIMLFTASLCASCEMPSATEKNHAPDKVPVVHSDDVHTQSNADSITVKHLDLDINISFEDKQIAGSATWAIENIHNRKQLILDTYDLTIDSVKVDEVKTDFYLAEANEILGSALHIPIQRNTQKVKVYYKSGANATALQWLTPTQTYDQRAPFLYTQSESIYARSWIPCPDGPGIRFTYSARVQTPKGLLALMSANNPQAKNDSSIYHFYMEIPIPAYLLSLAVGDVAFRPLGARSGVYAEPGLLPKAAAEFSQVEKMISQAEDLYGKYRWTRYDMIVLPPGFPIGGMENPRLTFLTPTIIAGDKSLVNLIAHELAHSWSGNLVTNATWNDFWLNEGFTVYFERRLTEKMYDTSYVDMLWALGFQDLENTVAELGPTSKDTHLKLDLTGRDPDEGLTDIAYEKGAHFLKMLELEVGRKRMDFFLNNYFNTYAFQTINTETFLIYLDKNLLESDSNLYKKLKVKEWVYGPGIPENCPIIQPARFKEVDALIAQLKVNNFDLAPMKTEKWSTYEWLHFLRGLPRPLSTTAMAAIDNKYALTATGNAEIACLWFTHAIASDYHPAYPALEKFVSRVGRRKFLEPLYKEMMTTGKEDLARKFFQLYAKNYHPLAQATMQEITQQPK